MKEIQRRAETLAHAIEVKLGVRGRGLAAKLRRGGRRLPRPVRAAGQALLQAEAMASVPKLAPQIDHAHLAEAYAAAERALAAIDPAERRKTIVLNWLAGNFFNVLLVGALAAGFIVWVRHMA